MKIAPPRNGELVGPPLWGHRKVPTISQVLPSVRYICFRKISGSNMGASNLFLLRPPSKLVTPLWTTLQKSVSTCQILKKLCGTRFHVTKDLIQGLLEREALLNSTSGPPMIVQPFCGAYPYCSVIAQSVSLTTLRGER